MSNPKQSSRIWRKLLVAWVVILGGIFGTAEVVARYVLHVPASPFERMEFVHSAVGLASFNSIFQFDERRFWRLKEGLHDLHVLGDMFGRHIDFTINTNASAMRVTQDAPCADGDAIRILALGDSCTFGFGVNDEDAWPNKLQQALNAKSAGRCFKVFNAGVPAYTSYQCLQYLREKGLALKPHVVIAQFWINDSATWGFGDYRMAKQIHPPFWIRLLTYSRFFHGLRLGMYGDGGHDVPRLSEDELDRTMAEFADLCKQNGIRVVFVVWPSEPDWKSGVLDPYPTAVKKFAIDNALPYIDALPAIYQKPGPWFVDVCHATPAGNAVVADLLTPEILRLCP